MKNIEIVNRLNSLESVAQSLHSKRLPVKLLYALKKNEKALLDAYSPYKETLDELGTKYSAEDPKLNEAVKELLETDCEVNIHKVKECELESCDGIHSDALTMQELQVLEFMIEEG